MRLVSKTLFAALVGIAPLTASAGGFAISETGSKYAGRGNAATALSDSASSIFINPANIAALGGFNFTAGVSFVVPQFKYTPAAGEATESEASLSAPPVVALTYAFALGDLGDLGLGVGFHIPYGSTFAWPSGWQGREAVQSISLATYEVQPALAFRYKDLFAIGGGLRVMPTGLKQTRAVRFGDQAEGTVALAAAGTAIGGAAGATLWPVKGLALSVAWRSAATLEGDGDANFDFPAPFDAAAIDTALEGTLPLPQTIRAGVAYDLIADRLNVSADFQYQFWETYQSLDVTFVNADGTKRTTSDPKKSMNSFIVYVGGELKLSEAFAVRAGYVFDQHTQPEEVIGPTPPDSDRHIITLGASYAFGAFSIDAHLADVIFAEREALTSPLPGTWSGALPTGASALIASIGISGRFGGGEAPAPAEAPAKEVE